MNRFLTDGNAHDRTTQNQKQTANKNSQLLFRPSSMDNPASVCYNPDVRSVIARYETVALTRQNEEELMAQKTASECVRWCRKGFDHVEECDDETARARLL